jgi:RNA polymerase sigma factor (sigma-70 family)
MVGLGDLMVDQRGDGVRDDGFALWYRDARRQLLAAVSAYTGDRHLAGDAVDEACCRALGHWERVGRMDSPTGWAYRVAVNYARRGARRHRLERRLGRGEASQGEVDVAGDVDLWRRVRVLPRRQREAIVLRYLLDLPEASIASAMHITRGAVSANLAKALARLAADVGSENGRSRDHG